MIGWIGRESKVSVLDKPEVEAEKTKDAAVVPIEASLKGTVATVSSPEGIEEFSSFGFQLVSRIKFFLFC
jgi:hypothetical protein